MEERARDKNVGAWSMTQQVVLQCCASGAPATSILANTIGLGYALAILSPWQDQPCFQKISESDFLSDFTNPLEGGFIASTN